jgi:NRPS condensation-like uncharacterized protein
MKMPTFSPPAVESRLMGWGELLWWRISQAGSTNGMQVLHFDGRIDVERLQRAMEQVSSVHPILRSRAVPQGQGARLEVQGPPVALVRVIERRDDNHWIEVVEQETNDRIPPDRFPLIHLTVVLGQDRSEMLLVVNHSIADGVAGVDMCELLFKIYAGQPVPPPRALAPAFDGIVNHGGAWALAKYGWRYLRDMVGKPPGVKFPLAKGVDPNTTGRTRLVDFMLDEETTSALLKRCKTHEVTLNGLISAAMLIASCDGIEAGPGPHRMAMSFAISLRPLLKVNLPDDFGYYVTGAEADHMVTPDSNPWALAKETLQDTARVFHGEHVKINSWLRWVILKLKPTGQSLLDAAPKSSRACFHITNMGRNTKPLVYDNLRLRRWFHFSSVHLARRPFICLSTVTSVGRLQLAFGYCEPHTDRAMVDRVLARFLSILNRAAQEPL